MIIFFNEDQTVVDIERKAKKNQYRAAGSKFAKYLSRLCTMRAWLRTYFDQKFMKRCTVYLPLQFERGNILRI